MQAGLGGFGLPVPRPRRIRSNFQDGAMSLFNKALYDSRSGEDISAILGICYE
jgi:hypothetical protein